MEVQKCCKRLPTISVLQHGAAPEEVLGMGKVQPLYVLFRGKLAVGETFYSG